MENNVRIDALGFSLRTLNALDRAGIVTLNELFGRLDCGINELFKVRNLGYNGVTEILRVSRSLGYPAEKIDVFLAAQMERPDFGTKSKWETLRKEVINIPVVHRFPFEEHLPSAKQVHSAKSLLSNPILNNGIRYNANNVVCPKCKKLIPTGERCVYIEGEGIPLLRVGLCVSCSSFYSYSNKVMNKAGICEGFPVRWSNLRYRSGRGNNIQYREIKLFQSMSCKQEQKHIQERKTATSIEPIPAPQYHISLKQLPIIKSSRGGCPICKCALDNMLQVEYMVYKDGIGVPRYSHARSCTKCNTVFFDEGLENVIREQNREYEIHVFDATLFSSAKEIMDFATSDPQQSKKAAADVILPFEDLNGNPPNLSEEHKTVLVYARKCHCARCQKKYGIDTIRNRTAILYSLYGNVIEANVMFCMGCDQYFMNYISFCQYQKDYGGVLMERKFTGELAEKFKANNNFAPDSILSRCGYTVLAGVCSEYRQSILRYILDTGKASKREVIELISGFIGLREESPIMEGACERWKEDIVFVNQYRIDEQRKIYGLSFKQGK